MEFFDEKGKSLGVGSSKRPMVAHVWRKMEWTFSAPKAAKRYAVHLLSLNKEPVLFAKMKVTSRQTHLSRATVIRCLNALKRKGYLQWIPGGRLKRGRVLSNLYQLTLPKPTPKRGKEELAEFWGGESGVSQCDPIIYRSAKDHPGGYNPPPPASATFRQKVRLPLGQRSGYHPLARRRGCGPEKDF